MRLPRQYRFSESVTQRSFRDFRCALREAVDATLTLRQPQAFAFGRTCSQADEGSKP